MDREILIPTPIPSDNVELREKLLQAVGKKIDECFLYFDWPDSFIVHKHHERLVANGVKTFACRSFPRTVILPAVCQSNSSSFEDKVEGQHKHRHCARTANK